MWLKLLGLIAVLIYSGCSGTGKLPAEYVERSVTVDGKAYRFRVFAPKGRNPNEKLPVMLYLHGSGSRGDDNMEPAFNFAAAIESVKDKVNFVVVLPQCADDNFWASTEMAKYSIAALDQSVNEFNGDEQRLYLAGFSLGGYGAMHLAAAYPGKFAALMPVAGGVVGERPILPEHRKMVLPQIEKMLDEPDPYAAVAIAIGQTPSWVFHGAKDEAVPVDFSRKIVEGMKAKGNTDVRYTEYENDGHMIFSKSFAEPGFFEWLGDQHLQTR